LKRLFTLALVAGLVAAGWLYRDRIAAALGMSGAGPVEPSPELADAAQRKLERLASGEDARVGLAQEEVQSLLLFRYAGLLPAFVDSPRVQIQGDRIRVRARVPVSELPRINELGEAAAILPDTTDIEIRGQLLPLDGGRVALAVDDVSASGIRVPMRLVPGALKRIGRVDEPGLPPDALALPLPPGATSAYIRGDSLFFVAADGRSGSVPGRRGG